MVTCYNHDVAIAISRTGPFLLQRLQPVNGLLYAIEGSRIGEIARMNQQFARVRNLRKLGMGIGDTGNSDGDRIWWGTMWRATQPEQYVVHKDDEGRDRMEEQEVDE